MGFTGISTAWLRSNFLQGISLEDSKGKPYPDSNLDAALKAVKSEWTRNYGLLWEPTRVILGEVPSGRIPAEPELTINSHGPDYDYTMWHGDKWAIMKVPFRPIKQLHYVAVSLGGTNQPAMMEFKEEWWRLDGRRNFLRLSPGFKNIAVSNLASIPLALLGGTRSVPQSWRIAYTAGFGDPQAEAPDLAWALGQAATIKVLPILASLLDRGGATSSQSVSVDGLSQSRSFPVSAQSHRYSPYQSSLQADVDKFLESYFDTRRPLMVV
jgi:hypothetical protein